MGPTGWPIVAYLLLVITIPVFDLNEFFVKSPLLTNNLLKLQRVFREICQMCVLHEKLAHDLSERLCANRDSIKNRRKQALSDIYPEQTFGWQKIIANQKHWCDVCFLSRGVKGHPSSLLTCFEEDIDKIAHSQHESPSKTVLEMKSLNGGHVDILTMNDLPDLK